MFVHLLVCGVVVAVIAATVRAAEPQQREAIAIPGGERKNNGSQNICKHDVHRLIIWMYHDQAPSFIHE